MIGFDLIRDMKMYNLPPEFIKELDKDNGMTWHVDPETYLENKLLCKSITIYLGDRITTEMVKNIPNLKWIHLTCVGMDKLEGIEALNRDIVVTNSKGIMTESMVSTIISMMFGLARIQPQCNYLKNSNLLTREAVNDYFFDNIQDVFGQTCLIVGHGEVGKKLEEVLEPFNMKVSTMSRTSKDYYLSDLEVVVPIYDYVINLLPYTHHTKNVFNKYIFKSMKQTSYFINIGRKQTVVEEDLIEALQTKEIAGVGLDVFESSDKFEKFNNVILSPHMASYSPSYWDKEMKLFKDNLNRYKSETSLINIVYDNSKNVSTDTNQ